MVGFVLTGHGQFAPGLASALDMVAGDQQAFVSVPFEGSRAVTYGRDLRRAVEEMRAGTSGVLVFVDLLGGTPFNQAMAIGTEVPDVEVVTGANLPMLIELLLTRTGESTLDELVGQALAVGQAGIVHKSLPAQDACDAPDEGEDGI